MCWFKVTAFWGSGVTFTTFFAGAALKAILRWVSWIDITSRDLVTFGTGKGERLSVNSSGVRSDDEGFAGHGLLGRISFNNIHYKVFAQSQA